MGYGLCSQDPKEVAYYKLIKDEMKRVFLLTFGQSLLLPPEENEIRNNSYQQDRIKCDMPRGI